MSFKKQFISIGFKISDLQINDKGYANVIVAELEGPDQYGNNVEVLTSLSKEDREAKKESDLLGRGRTLWRAKGETGYVYKKQS
tara:strand:- start:430 stop:681 length:252 start_codon:yes stop_codon:yes gene_type:complete